MKKTKKLLATVLSLAMATTMLSACSSGSSENNQSSKEPTASVAPTSIVEPTTSVEPTESAAPTDESGKDATKLPEMTIAETEAVTTAEETSANESIIPLFKSEYTIDDIKKISPEELQTFDTFCKYYPVEILDQKDDGFTICNLVYEDHFKLGSMDGNFYDVGFLVYGKPGCALTGIYDTAFELSTEQGDLFYEYYDDSTGRGFIPLFYDKERYCLVGYLPNTAYRAMLVDATEDYDIGSRLEISPYNNTDYYLVEAYRNPISYNVVFYQKVDASRYGM